MKNSVMVMLAVGTIVLSACGEPAQPISGESSPEAAGSTVVPAAQIDLLALRDQVIGAGAPSLSLVKSNGQGFVFLAGDVVHYHAFPSRGLVTRTSVLSGGTDEVCLAQVDRWSGACIRVFNAGDGMLEVRYKFGNGWTCHV